MILIKFYQQMQRLCIGILICREDSEQYIACIFSYYIASQIFHPRTHHIFPEHTTISQSIPIRQHFHFQSLFQYTKVATGLLILEVRKYSERKYSTLFFLINNKKLLREPSGYGCILRFLSFWKELGEPRCLCVPKISERGVF